mmetsp:Transcript_149095/g.478872  ORF Transcript_149095/g.478872 Transcript_149095/m.478872 type:complete len:215 (+) Transcript_149095:462-1106(+)
MPSSLVTEPLTIATSRGTPGACGSGTTASKASLRALACSRLKAQPGRRTTTTRAPVRQRSRNRTGVSDSAPPAATSNTCVVSNGTLGGTTGAAMGARLAGKVRRMSSDNPSPLHTAAPWDGLYNEDGYMPALRRVSNRNSGKPCEAAGRSLTKGSAKDGTCTIRTKARASAMQTIFQTSIHGNRRRFPIDIAIGVRHRTTPQRDGSKPPPPLLT